MQMGLLRGLVDNYNFLIIIMEGCMVDDKDNEICVFCRKRIATKLCDFPTGTVKTSIDFKTHRTTCDRPVCEECSINIADDTDFCPHCMKKYQEKFINWKKQLKYR